MGYFYPLFAIGVQPIAPTTLAVKNSFAILGIIGSIIAPLKLDIIAATARILNSSNGGVAGGGHRGFNGFPFIGGDGLRGSGVASPVIT